MLDLKQVEDFKEKGFLVIDLGLDESLIDGVVSEVLPHYERKNGSTDFRNGSRLQDIWKSCPSVHRLAVNSTILQYLEQLFERKPLPFQTLNFPTGTQQTAHSDTLHFNSMPSGFMAGTWVALEDIHKNNGPVIYYPGSHKFPEYTMQDVNAGVGYENYDEYICFLRSKLDESGIEPYCAELQKGQALLWHANLIHGGSKQLDKNLTRHSQVTHYYFKGCKYYTPMNSSPGNIDWRKPKWIPKNPDSKWRKILSQFKM